MQASEGKELGQVAGMELFPDMQCTGGFQQCCRDS